MMVMPETQVSQGERCRVIAERVMGLSVVMGEVDGVHVEKPYQWPFARTTRGGLAEIPDYFTDPAAMVDVMDKLADGGFRPLVNHIQGSWHACVTDPNSPWDTRPTGSRSYESFQPAIHARGPTPMFAVAEAAYQWSVASVTPPADASSSSAP